MKFSLYTVFDNVAKTSTPLFHAVNDDVAVRFVRESFRKKDFVDCSLFCLGEYDSDAMRLKNFGKKRLVDFDTGSLFDSFDDIPFELPTTEKGVSK